MSGFRPLVLLVATTTLLSACNDQGGETQANRSGDPENMAAVDQPHAPLASVGGTSSSATSTSDAGASDRPDEAAPEEETAPPLTRDELRFVGSWATEVSNCRSKAWQFTRTSLRTPAGSVCAFSNVKVVPGGYDIAATCTAEGPPHEETLNVRFAESAKAMLFESEAIADAGLIKCGS